MNEEIRKLPKRNIVLYLSIVVVLISLTFKASYAFFTASVENTTTPTNSVVQTAELKINFGSNASYINATDLSLMTAEEAATSTNNVSRFKVTNTGSVAGKYRLYLSNYSITENLVHADFKWKLTVNGTNYTGTFYDLFNGKTATDGVIASSTVDIPLVSSDISLANNSEHACEFRIWIEETEQNQIGLTNGSFSGQIKLIAINN